MKLLAKICRGLFHVISRYLSIWIKIPSPSSRAHAVYMRVRCFTQKQIVTEQGLKCFMNEINKPGHITTILDNWEATGKNSEQA